MDKFTAARIDTGMAHVGGSIVFKEDQIAFLQIVDRGDLRPAAHGREPGRAVPAHADAAGAQAEIYEAGAVEPSGRAFFRPGILDTHHRARYRNQAVRTIGCVVADIVRCRRFGSGGRIGHARCFGLGRSA